MGQKSPGLSTRVGGAPTPLGVGPCLVDDSETSLMYANISYKCSNLQKIT